MATGGLWALAAVWIGLRGGVGAGIGLGGALAPAMPGLVLLA